MRNPMNEHPDSCCEASAEAQLLELRQRILKAEEERLSGAAVLSISEAREMLHVRVFV